MASGKQIYDQKYHSHGRYTGRDQAMEGSAGAFSTVNDSCASPPSVVSSQQIASPPTSASRHQYPSATVHEDADRSRRLTTGAFRESDKHDSVLGKHSITSKVSITSLEQQHHDETGKRRRSNHTSKDSPEHERSLESSDQESVIVITKPNAQPGTAMHPSTAFAPRPHEKSPAWQRQTVASDGAEVRRRLPSEGRPQEVSVDSADSVMQDSGRADQDNDADSDAQQDIDQGVKKIQARKRTFSQRTKTGCQTRKKKCDEAKPKCNNCTRGGFQCQGYGPKSDVEYRAAKGKAIPLQSKAFDYHGPAGYYPSNARAPTEQWLEGQTGLVRVEPRGPVPFKGTLPPIDSTSTWSGRLSTIPDRDRGSTWRSEPRHSRPSFGEQSRPDQRPHTSQYGSGEPTASTSSGSLVSGFDRSRSAMTAQMALHHSAAFPTGFQVHVSEKEKMLTGKPYRHFIDPQLIEERRRCRAALERFNTAAKPSTGSSPEECNRLFRAIIKPVDLDPTRGSTPLDTVGSVGERVIVESPFTCDYGYNINIGDDVVIQPGCIMVDPCKIHIGSRSVVGPNVRFYGMTAPIDPKLRAGSQGMVYGGMITIEEDCFIGGDVIILPNRTIRRGSIVGAGTTVSKDVPPDTIVAGSPMRVLRGIGPSANDSHAPHIQAQNDASIQAMIRDRYGPREGVFGRI